MKRIIFASTEENVGKTSIILGLARTLKKKVCYLKPFGDRMKYHKKKLWDYDAELVNTVLNLGLEPEKLTLGFEHTKMRYQYDKDTAKEKVLQMCHESEFGKEITFIEGANTLTYGASVAMNSLRMARITNAPLIIVLSGNSDKIQDELTFIRHNIVENDVNFAGVIINKVNDIEDLKSDVTMEYIDKLKVKIFGLIPYEPRLETISMRQICDVLMATPITAPAQLDNEIDNIYIGAMSLNEVLKKKYLQKGNNLLITSGDRSDIILAGIESNSKGIVLTNNILPPPNIISSAGEKNIPMLLAAKDTYAVAKQIDHIDVLLDSSNETKLHLLDRLISENVNIQTLL